jgi:hypothetical protein
MSVGELGVVGRSGTGTAGVCIFVLKWAWTQERHQIRKGMSHDPHFTHQAIVVVFASDAPPSDKPCTTAGTLGIKLMHDECGTRTSLLKASISKCMAPGLTPADNGRVGGILLHPCCQTLILQLGG